MLRQYLPVIILLVSFGIFPAHAQPPAPSVADLQTQLSAIDGEIQQQTARNETFTKDLATLKKTARNLKTEVLNQQISLKQLDRQAKKIRVLSANPDSAETQEKFNKVAYRRKVTELELANNEQLQALKQADIQSLKDRIALQNSAITDLQRKQRRLQSQQQQLLSQQKKQAEENQRQAKIARQREVEAAAERQRQLALKKSNSEKLQHQLQQQQLDQQNRAREQEKNRLAAKRQAKERAAVQQQEMTDQSFVDKQQRLIAENAHLPQAEAALNIAKAWAQDPLDNAPKYGHQLTLMVSNPSGSKANPIAELQHLGNNQYTGRLKIKKGRQEFIVGDHKYTKLVAKHFNNLECIVVVDARGNRPEFKLMVAPDI
ncbi:Uncharacterised protein [BD1-7 clade bacterium]|uniref:Chromosome partition protein Smc n=1 Tax=BD1-7 clade bacterium TaxID=2029982 RepID=A0A5S9QZU6_9GAMM|nr:Uncharacterised protein [BD1-7 clade bacterium]